MTVSLIRNIESRGPWHRAQRHPDSGGCWQRRDWWMADCGVKVWDFDVNVPRLLHDHERLCKRCKVAGGLVDNA